MKAFVDLEHYNGLSLIQKVHRSLVSLSKVIRGSILVDESVSKLADKLMGQETPPRSGHYIIVPHHQVNFVVFAFLKKSGSLNQCK